MAFSVDSVLSILLGNPNQSPASDVMVGVNQEAMAHTYDAMSPFTLGTDETKSNKKRTRKEIMTKWEAMLKFAPVAEGIGIHVLAALGGDEHTSKQVFITPCDRLRDATGKVNQEQLKKLEARIKPMENLINKHIVKICTDALGFGDSYARIYGKKGKGVTGLMCNEYTYPPLIQPFEQGSKTVAYFGLDPRNWLKTISKLSSMQMVRMKMPRIHHIPQYEMVEGLLATKVLQGDIEEELPILPTRVGGSYLYLLEDHFDAVILSLATMNSQQVADAVNRIFLTMNMAGMPPMQREAYKRGLEGMLKEHEKFVKNALSGGEAIWNTKYHVLPTWDEKQILSPIGDIKGQRTAPVNIETFMINVRLLMGGLGLDPSMVGWADMLAGGLGDGAASITYSSQVMRRSMPIRQSAKEIIDDILHLDWGNAYGEQFEDPLDYPWKVEYYSDQTAAMNQSLTNKQTRTNTLLLKTQAITAIKEAGLNKENTARLLEKDGGCDYDEAQELAEDIAGQREQEEKIN